MCFAKIVPKMLEFVMDVLCENCAKDEVKTSFF
jgi:hypothetical protein